MSDERAMTPVEKAAARWDENEKYVEAGAFPPTLQQSLAAWQLKCFGPTPLWQTVMGASEEVGELEHAVLKNAQGIRGMDDPTKFREAAGDAIADAAIFLIQVASKLGLDFDMLVEATAKKVMTRNWKDKPVDGGAT